MFPDVGQTSRHCFRNKTHTWKTKHASKFVGKHCLHPKEENWYFGTKFSREENVETFKEHWYFQIFAPQCFP
jgi:hypothetical protein